MVPSRFVSASPMIVCLAERLTDQGIGSISLNPDTVVDTWLRLASHKKG